MSEHQIPEPPRSTGFSLPPPSLRKLEDGTGERRKVLVLAVVILSISMAGLFTGISQESRPTRREVPPTRSSAARAPSYADLRGARRGPNVLPYAEAVGAFEELLPSRTETPPPQSSAERMAVLAKRAENRAYDGAPPTIPHAVRADSAFECLACHERGAVIVGKRAPAMSHERRDNCTQCHAPASGLTVPSLPPLSANSFEGASAASSGARAWSGAPPVIPHSTKMRSVCGSCHGVSGALGMRSTHPWRESCTQCHVPSAALDQRFPDAEIRP